MPQGRRRAPRHCHCASEGCPAQGRRSLLSASPWALLFRFTAVPQPSRCCHDLSVQVSQLLASQTRSKPAEMRSAPLFGDFPEGSHPPHHHQHHARIPRRRIRCRRRAPARGGHEKSPACGREGGGPWVSANTGRAAVMTGEGGLQEAGLSYRASLRRRTLGKQVVTGGASHGRRHRSVGNSGSAAARWRRH